MQASITDDPMYLKRPTRPAMSRTCLDLHRPDMETDKHLDLQLNQTNASNGRIIMCFGSPASVFSGP